MKKILLGFMATGLIAFVGCSVNKPSGATDIDGNTYKSVIIGEQEWMSENLNVGHFRNGDTIQEANTIEEWIEAVKNKQPAWCYYDNNPSNGEKYGKLYNWYAVSDSRFLAPDGWHVPTNAEQTLLIDYLGVNGHNGTEGKVLKATSGWTDKKGGTNGTDDYGWSGVPGGLCNPNGAFFELGNEGYWWSSSQSNTRLFWPSLLSASHDHVGWYGGNMNYGFSVRCLRD